MSTSNPPRARSPSTEPSFQTSGSAGNSSRTWRPGPSAGRHVSGGVVGLVDVVEPLLELAVLADAVGRDAPADLGEPSGEVAVNAQDPGGLDGVPQQGPDKLVVHRRPDAERVLLGGD